MKCCAKKKSRIDWEGLPSGLQLGFKIEINNLNDEELTENKNNLKNPQNEYGEEIELIQINIAKTTKRHTME